MKILLVGDYPNDPRLGSSKVPFKLREEFTALGHNCDIVCSDDLGKWPSRYRLRWALAPILAARAISRLFCERGWYDVVDIASAEGFIFGLQKRIGRYRRTVFISRSNGLEHLNYQRMLEDHDAELMQKPWHRRLWYPTVRMSQVAGAARLADHLLLLNERDRNFAMERHWKPPDDLSVVPHGVSSRFLETGFDPSHERGCGILFCGTWTGVKGIDYLADAFSWLVAEGERVRLTILGGGIPEDEIRRCFSAEAQTFLIILPRMVEELVIEQYRKHDILVFCSTYEGFGMVLLEAMSQGLPVISTPVGAAITLVRHGETGLSVPCRDADALAQAIRLLIQNAALRKRLAASAWQLVKGMTWEKTAKATLEVYQRKTACP